MSTFYALPPRSWLPRPYNAGATASVIVRQGPLSPAVAAEFARVHFGLSPRQFAKALDAIHAAASGKTIRLHGVMIITAGGNGEVNIDLPRVKA